MLELFSQIVVNIIADAFIVGLLALGMGLRVRTAKVYDFSYFAFFPIGAYSVWYLSSVIGINLGFSVTLSLIFVGALAFLIDLYLFRVPLKSARYLESMIASLGVFVIVENLLSLLAGPDNKRLLDDSADVVPLSWLPGSPILNTSQIAGICISALILLILLLIMKKSRWGICLRATDDSRELALSMGLRPWRVVSQTQVLCAVMAGMAGILYGLDRDLVPEMSLRPMLHVTVAIVLGGLGMLMGPFWGLLVVTVIWHFSGVIFDTKWQDVSVFVVLLAVLLFMPKGISGSLTGSIRNS